MARALAVMLLLSVLGALLGPFVVTRRLEFLTDALTHTVLPGVIVGFVLGGTPGVFWGALVAALLTAAAVTLLFHARRLRQDAAVAVLLTTMFALGVVLLSRRSDYAGDLSNFLTGQPLTLATADVVTVAVVAAAVLGGLAGTGYLLYQRAFDAELLAARGHRLLAADLVLNGMIALTVVCAVRTVGTLVALSVLLLPGVIGTALSRRWPGAIAAGGAGLALSCWLGLGLSYQASVAAEMEVPPSATTVLTGCALAGIAGIAGRAGRRLGRQGRADVG
jgi:manganese/iron transport system permease protein